MASSSNFFEHHQHGKSKVRLGRVWRQGAVHHIVEWNVNISLISDSEQAYRTPDCGTIVATDTMKNTVYALAKQVPDVTSPEEFALFLGKHFVDYYPVVQKSKVSIVEKPWERVTVGGKAHDHGFKLGSEKHTVSVEVDKQHNCSVTSGIADLAVLKTTQSGFEKFIHDKYTLLNDTRERIVATSVTATWTYSTPPASYTAAFAGIKESMLETFFGPAQGGVYSPSVQFTLYNMASDVLAKFSEVESVYLNMPNLHFIPCNLPGISVKFEDDVYFPTSEPHGTIEARLKRGQSAPVTSRL